MTGIATCTVNEPSGDSFQWPNSNLGVASASTLCRGLVSRLNRVVVLSVAVVNLGIGPGDKFALHCPPCPILIRCLFPGSGELTESPFPLSLLDG